MTDNKFYYGGDGNSSFFRGWLVRQTIGGTRVSRGFDVLDLPRHRYTLSSKQGQAEFIRDFDSAMEKR